MKNFIKDKLIELEASSNTFWNVPRDVGQFLNLLVKIHKPKHILELGSSNGYSTIWLALAAKEVNADVMTIEYFQERIDLAKKNFTYCQVSDVITIKQGKILDLIKNTTEAYDFVFIDANKSEYISYLKELQENMPRGGIVIADNITSHKNDLVPYVEFLESNPNFESVFIPMGSGILLSFKI